MRDSDGCAAVHVAVSCGYSNIVSYLIAKGTDSNLFDANGKTPLMWSAWRTFGFVFVLITLTLFLKFFLL